MLIRSIARETLGIKDHRVESVAHSEEGITIRLELRRRRRLPCSRCGTRSRVRDRLEEREWRHVPLWGIPVRLRYAPARRFLKKWFWWATHSRLKPMRDFAWTLRRHEEEVLNYFTLPIDNGAVEGLNNKAKVVSHRCYGFRTANTYITALYHCLGNLPEPELVHRFL